jgi:hypothetical protein
MSTKFHLRWAHEDQLPPKPADGKRSTYNVRPVVAGAQSVILEIDPTAVEILCNVCGESLRAPQRAALLPTLHHVVSNTELRSQGTGPLSQAGELCALLGLAQFALRAPEPWLFVRIPEASIPQPDIFALSPGGNPWYLELKGVAKLAPQVKPGARMETCGNVVSQISKARAQVTGTTLIEPDDDAPEAEIHATSGVPSFAEKAGGIALSVVVLADAALLNRSDILAPNATGCPSGKSCADHCLRAPSTPPQTSIVGLLWTEEQPVPASTRRPRTDALSGTLVALKALDLAAWAASPVGARESLDSLAQHLSNGELSAAPADTASVMSAGLRVSRGFVDRATRRAAVERVAEHLLASLELPERAQADHMIAGLFDEADAGLPEDTTREPVPLRNAFRLAADEILPIPVIVERSDSPGERGLELSGVLRGRTLRLAPRLSELRRWLSGEAEGGLLEGATTVVTRLVLPHVGAEEFESEAREGRQVGVRLQEGGVWTVGREWGWNDSGATLLDRLPRHLQDSFAWRCAHAIYEQDASLLISWGYAHRAELADAARVSRCDVRDALEELYHREVNNSRSRLSRTLAVVAGMQTLLTGPPSSRRLWAALDGTISAQW